MSVYKDDEDLLVAAYKEQGIKITREQAGNIWSAYSEDLCASWIMMGDKTDNLFGMTKEYAKMLGIV